MGRKSFKADLNAVSGFLKEVTADDQIARSLYCTPSGNGDNLLADSLRMLALLTPRDDSMAAEWERVLDLDRYDDAAVPAFLGLSRADPVRARAALPRLARALAAQDRPGPFAVALKSFATAGYLDDPPADPTPFTYTADDFQGLFSRVVGTDAERKTFIDRTFKALDKLKFGDPETRQNWREAIPEGAGDPRKQCGPVLAFTALLNDPTGDAVVSSFRDLAWSSGRDARLALPLLARGLAMRSRPDRLARVLADFRAGNDFAPSNSQRQYVRAVLDDGDFRSLFVLVPAYARPAFADDTFAALRSILRSVEADETPLQGWRAAAREPLTGVLWDAVDSPLFQKFSALHPLLVPELKAADPKAFGRLDALYAKPEPRRAFFSGGLLTKPKFWNRGMEPMLMAPADRLLYEAAQSLTAYLERVRAGVRELQTRFAVSPDGSDCTESEAGLLRKALGPAEEECLLTILMPRPSAEPVRGVEHAVAGLLTFFENLGSRQSEKIMSVAQVPQGVAAFERVIRPGLKADADEHLKRLWPDARRRIEAEVRTFRAVDAGGSDSALLLRWTRSNLEQLLGISDDAPSGLVRDAASGSLTLSQAA